MHSLLPPSPGKPRLLRDKMFLSVSQEEAVSPQVEGWAKRLSSRGFLSHPPKGGRGAVAPEAGEENRVTQKSRYMSSDI